MQACFIEVVNLVQALREERMNLTADYTKKFAFFNPRGKIFLLCLSLALSGCGPRSLEDFREEGEKSTRTLIKELQVIQTREELLQKTAILQRLFDALVTDMIAARDFKEKQGEMEPLELTSKNHELSDQLRQELNRIYRLEGGQAVIEKCQEQALYRLDEFEKKSKKKKAF